MPAPVDPVLVVGTTADYIERISESLPERAVFLIDKDYYTGLGASPIRNGFQVYASLQYPDEAFSKLWKYITDRGIRLGGVACFDCESLLLASDIAERLSLPFPSGRTVMNCRDKLVSRRLWHEAGIRCPRAILVRDEEDVRAFAGILQNPVVMKPTSLSGSELTFVCERPDDAVEATHIIKEGLRRRSGDMRLNRDRMVDEDALLCEEYIAGDEYSCDFVSAGRETRIIRTSRKYLLEGGPAGTVQAYEVPGTPWNEGHEPDLAGIVADAARALGLERCMGMADFIIREGQPYFLEITPRPGGDCLPQVIKQSCGLDMLEAHLGFSAGMTLEIPPAREWKPTVGLRIHARRRGRLEAVRLRADRVGQDILETGWYREPGDRIGLPPEDYETWLLGHVIFRPVQGDDTYSQIKRMAESVEVRIE